MNCIVVAAVVAPTESSRLGPTNWSRPPTGTNVAPFSGENSDRAEAADWNP